MCLQFITILQFDNISSPPLKIAPTIPDLGSLSPVLSEKFSLKLALTILE
jgi:hypothetical protein